MLDGINREYDFTQDYVNSNNYESSKNQYLFETPHPIYQHAYTKSNPADKNRISEEDAKKINDTYGPVDYDSVMQDSRPVPVGGDYSRPQDKYGRDANLNYIPLQRKNYMTHPQRDIKKKLRAPLGIKSVKHMLGQEKKAGVNPEAYKGPLDSSKGQKDSINKTWFGTTCLAL